MPLAFERSILTSPGPFLAGTATQTQTYDGSIFTASDDGNVDVCFVGLDASGRPVFICVGYRTPSSRYVQACRINTDSLTVTAGSVLQLNTFQGTGANDGRMSIAGQSHGGYRFNGSSPVQASAGGYLLAMAMVASSSTATVLYGLKIKEDTLTITLDASETFTTSVNNVKVDALDNDTWVIIADKFYQREFTGSGSITSRGDITVPSTGSTFVQLQDYFGMTGKWQVIGKGSGNNVYCVNVGTRSDSTRGMQIGVVELETDSTAWQYARSFTIEALGFQNPAGVTSLPQFVAMSDTKILALASVDRAYPDATIDARVATFTLDTTDPYTGQPNAFNYTTTPNISLGTLTRQNFVENAADKFVIFATSRCKLLNSHKANTYHAVAPLYPATTVPAGYTTSKAFTIATIKAANDVVEFIGFNNVSVPGENSYGNSLITVNFPVAAYDQYILYWGGNDQDNTVNAQYAVPIKVL